MAMPPTHFVLGLKESFSFAVATSQTFTEPSQLPEHSVLPSGVNARHRTRSVWPLNSRINLPVVASQSSNLLSDPPLATDLPSGATSTQETFEPLSCSLNATTSLAVATSQPRTMLSPPPGAEYTIFPSGDIARSLISP